MECKTEGCIREALEGADFCEEHDTEEKKE